MDNGDDNQPHVDEVVNVPQITIVHNMLQSKQLTRKLPHLKVAWNGLSMWLSNNIVS